MPVEAIMSRISEIRSMVGIDPVAAPTDTEQVAETADSSSADQLGVAFADELSSAVSSGDLSGAASLINEFAIEESSASQVRAGTAAAAPVPPVQDTDGQQSRSTAEAVAPVESVAKTRESAPPSAGSGDSVVAEARKYLGVPYVWGGTNPGKGLDCSGLVQLVFRNLGVELPRVARQQATRGTKVPSLAKAQPGDLLGMRNGTHIAIYLGDNKILHAPRPGEKVSIRELTRHDDIDTIRRVALPASEGSQAVSALTSQARSALAGS